MTGENRALACWAIMHLDHEKGVLWWGPGGMHGFRTSISQAGLFTEQFAKNRAASCKAAALPRDEAVPPGQMAVLVTDAIRQLKRQLEALEYLKRICEEAESQHEQE